MLEYVTEDEETLFPFLLIWDEGGRRDGFWKLVEALYLLYDYVIRLYRGLSS